ncbi:MAG TPA: hypothetical protein VF845_03025 [Terriglobales bacterium]
MDNFEQSVARILAFKWKYVGQHLVQQHTGRKDIGSQIDMGTADLLGGHVLDASYELAGARDVFRPDPSNSEVNQLDGAILQKHHVPGLDVPVNNTLLMRIRQSAANLDHCVQLFF